MSLNDGAVQIILFKHLPLTPLFSSSCASCSLSADSNESEEAVYAYLMVFTLRVLQRREEKGKEERKEEGERKRDLSGVLCCCWCS